MSWHPAVYQDWLQGQYTKVVEYYEECLGQEAENPNDYWCLGLAYLLLGQEEQAQLTWLLVLSQYNGGALDSQVQSLTEILETEAERFEQKKNYQAAWLIRGHIQEIDPNDPNNLIRFVVLDILMSSSSIDALHCHKITQLCQSFSLELIADETFIFALSIISKIPSLDAISFISYCLEIDRNTNDFISVIYDEIWEYIDQKKYSKYVVEVLKVFLIFQPNNLHFINIIYILYGEFNDFDSAIEYAKIFVERSHLITDKLFASAQLLYTLIKISNWHEVLLTSQQYIELLKNFLNRTIDSKYPSVYNSIISVNQPLLYLHDSLQENRLLGSYIAKVFQENFLKETDINVSYLTNFLTTDRPLKVGYIGHTLRSHPVGYLGRWLFCHNDPTKIQNYAYQFSNNVDQFTQEWFVERMECYSLFPRDVKAVVQKIQADQIDILIDLDGWTCDSTCQVMAIKPAPIQVTWLGFDASGIPNVDYFIADPYVLPDNAQNYYSEKIWRLPNCYLGIDGFEIGVPTLRREDLNIPQDAVIFANYQNAFKRHPYILHQQMRILKAVPNSYFLVKGTGKANAIEELFKSISEEENIMLDRLRFLEPCATEMEHRANLRLVDVMLDTYPYNGATTTLETLWMEIPLVTRVGEQFAARNSYTFMINAGITEGIAWSDEEYVEWGIRLGTDENLRKAISYKLRQSKQTSPLWNGKQFAREMENAYRQMWEIYIQGKC